MTYQKKEELVGKIIPHACRLLNAIFEGIQRIKNCLVSLGETPLSSSSNTFLDTLSGIRYLLPPLLLLTSTMNLLPSHPSTGVYIFRKNLRWDISLCGCENFLEPYLLANVLTTPLISFACATFLCNPFIQTSPFRYAFCLIQCS